MSSLSGYHTKSNKNVSFNSKQIKDIKEQFEHEPNNAHNIIHDAREKYRMRDQAFTSTQQLKPNNPGVLKNDKY